MAERIVDCFQKLIAVKRLDKESKSAALHHSGLSCMIFVSSNENHPSSRRSGTQMGEKLHSSHFVHPDIQNDQWNRICRHVFEKSFRLAESTHPKPIRLKQTTDRFQDRGIVINEANNFSWDNFGTVMDQWRKSCIS